MQRAIAAIGLAGLMVIGATAAAVEPGQSALMKQQMIDCMNKKMSVNKTLSYNDAMRACKVRLQPSKDTLAANNAVATAAKPH
jgi:hypothetical protein